jgi:hypothetical protein
MNMQKYEKPVHTLMKEMVNEFALLPSQAFTRQQVIDWFARRYPMIQKGTITVHLIRLSTNAKSRIHYSPKPSDDDVLFQIDSSHFRRYDPARDPPPIRDSVPQPDRTPPDEEEEAPTGSEFAYESDLRNYLAKNLSHVEPGLRLYDEDGITGIEFPVGGRFIDVLAVDLNNDLVVIELKVSRGYDRVVGQLARYARYVAWIKKNQADTGQRVRGVIVAREITEDLLLAASQMTDVQLFEYELSLRLRPINDRPGD